jgi:DNA-binding ferritin-like protein
VQKVILNLIKLQQQLRICHWQTDSYARHKAFGKTYDLLDDQIDTLVETFQGKYQRIAFDSPANIELLNIDEVGIEPALDEVIEYLSTVLPEKINTERDTELLNIRDEILQTVDHLKYLLTFK